MGYRGHWECDACQQEEETDYAPTEAPYGWVHVGEYWLCDECAFSAATSWIGRLDGLPASEEEDE